MDIRQQRLANQRLAGNPFTTAAEVVTWLGAAQAQDYAGAKWAIAQRTNGLTEAAIEQAFAAGAILRTHVMRPTWHLTLPGPYGPTDPARRTFEGRYYFLIKPLSPG
jgi:hypothetical protein